MEAIHRYGIKQVDIARDTGINHSSLSLWLQAKIKGHFVKIEETLEEWLKSMHSNKNHFSSIGASSRALNKNIHDKNLNDTTSILSSHKNSLVFKNVNENPFCRHFLINFKLSLSLFL